MSEKKTENTNKGMKFHKLYTYVYLPLSAVIALFIALGRFYHIETISLSYIGGWIQLIHETYPLVCSILSIIALPFLIGKTNFGRRMVLFSETLKSLLCIILIASYLSYGNVLPAFIYTLLVFAMALVYGYYRMREWEFNPIEIEEKNEEHSTTDSVEKEEEIKEEEKTKEEIKEESPSSVEEIEIKEEEKEISIVETDDNYDPSATIKITSIIPATFISESPILVEDVTIRTEKEASIILIKVRNISDKAFSSSLWSMDGIREFKSNKMITPKSEVVINALLNVPTDRASIRLLSIDEYGGASIDLRHKARLTLPEKHPLSSLSRDDRFPFFIDELKNKEDVNAQWIYMEDESSSSWLCPQCGIPVLVSQDKCPLCSLSREKAEVFSSSSLTLLFNKATGTEK